MLSRNVTLSLPVALVKKAKILAAREEKSLSQMMRETLEEKVTQKSGYWQAWQRQKKWLEKGFDLGTGGRVTWTREELHERR